MKYHKCMIIKCMVTGPNGRIGGTATTPNRGHSKPDIDHAFAKSALFTVAMST